MKLFEKIPASFFSVLASPNREIYWAALATLLSLVSGFEYVWGNRSLLADR